jgi:hypothetical protein
LQQRTNATEGGRELIGVIRGRILERLEESIDSGTNFGGIKIGERLPPVMPWLRSLDDNRPVLRPLPEMIVARAQEQWMPHARFDHDAHRGILCVGCHAKALTSTEASDILLPGIATRKTCHAPGPGHADTRCSECHTYHDWPKRKEVTPKFTLPELRTGGQ